MKKILSAVLALMMIVGCASFVSAKEPVIEGTNNVAVAIDDVVVTDATQQIEVPVNVKFAEDFDGILGATLKFTYDTSKLTFDKKASSIEYPVDSSIAMINENKSKVVTISFAPADLEVPSKEDGVFAVLVFNAVEGANGDAVIEFADGTKFANSENKASTFNTTNGKVTLPAAETPKYDVTFDANLEGVTSPDAMTDVEAGTEIDLPELDDTADYTFRGWQVNGAGDVLTGKYTVTADTALKGAWAVIEKYDVTFVSDYGTAPNSMTDVLKGTKITLVKLDDTDEFTFGGWTDGENEYAAGAEYEVTGDVTLAAIWNRIVKYNVFFSEGVEGYETVAGTVITLPGLDNTDDYTFGGWVVEGTTEPIYAEGAKYTVNADVKFVAKWNEIVKYTVTFSEGADPVTVVAGQSVTVPTLEKTDLVFKGWKVGETDEIVAGGAEFVPTASVLLTAQWKAGSNKVYIDTTGNDANDGLTKDTPVKTLKRVQEILTADKAADNILNTIVVVEKYEKKNEAAANTDNLGQNLGKKLYITGLTPESIFDMHHYKADGTTAQDSHLRIYTDVEFNNITFVGSGKDGGPMAMGYELTFGENVTASGSQGIAHAHYNNIYKDGGIINVNSGTFGRVHFAGMSGAKVLGTTTTNINGGKVNGIYNGHGWRNNNIVYGANYININGGEVGQITLNAVGTSSVTSYAGLRYFTINDGTVGNVTTTGIKQATYKDGDVDKFVNTDIRDGVTVFEVNGGTVGKFATVGEDDDATRVIINNTANALTVEDTGAIVLNVKNGKLHAETTGFGEDGKPTYVWNMNNTAVLDWAKTVELTGFSYEFAESGLAAEFNAVKVGDKTYALADLTNGLIPAPEAAGTYNVEFTNVYKVTIGEETTLVEEGDTIALTRLPKNGDLKHIGWTTVEGGETAEIDHTSEYAPTADVTLYPVWAEAVYFTATFETDHGEAPAAISIIDDDEDGKADEAFMFPGYDGKQDEHFTFTGWMDRIYVGTPEGTVIPKYNAGDILTLDGNKTFIATWVEDPKGTVTYRNESGEAPEAVTDYVGTEIVIAECPAVEGFEFLGWIADGVTYQPGEKYTIEDEFGIAFTAKWGVKVAVDTNGAKGEAPVIGGAIGEEIDLPTEVALTYVNHTFKGFALAVDGEIITGKYTVNPEDTLYVIWEETVADAAIIETKVVYNSATNDYTVDMYFYGADANTVAFGYTYGENLEFVSFAPAAGLVVTPDALEVKEDGYYAYAVTNQETGKIEGASASAGNGVHLGTITFTYTGTKEDYSEDDAADNIAITAPKTVVDNVSSAEYFLYTPAVSGLEVIGLPVVFDEAIEYEIVDVVYTVNGSVKVVRADGTAPKNYAEIEVYNEQGSLYKTFVIEDAETTTVDGVFNYEIGLGAGKYTFVVKKTGYLAAECDVEIAVQEGAGEDGFVPTPVDVALVELTAGDVVADFGVIDLLDFAGIVQAFDRGDLEADETIALDINEDGVVGVDDLKFVKDNFGAKAE
ncbi:MAG: hypothetical protein E7583_00855 [Ruminococcaceae bacterium]|nr:hypothetical protein [Oscillospiraceae bacterium]